MKRCGTCYWWTRSPFNPTVGVCWLSTNFDDTLGAFEIRLTGKNGDPYDAECPHWTPTCGKTKEDEK